MRSEIVRRLIGAGLAPAAAAAVTQLGLLLLYAGPDRPVLAPVLARFALLQIAIGLVVGGDWAAISAAISRTRTSGSASASTGRAGAGATPMPGRGTLERATASVGLGFAVASAVFFILANFDVLWPGSLLWLSSGAMATAVVAGGAAGLGRFVTLAPSRAGGAILVEPPAVAVWLFLSLALEWDGRPLLASTAGALLCAGFALVLGLACSGLERRGATGGFEPDARQLLPVPVLAIALIVATAFSGHAADPSPLSPAAGVSEGGRPDVLLVVIDTTRAERVSAYVPGVNAPVSPAGPPSVSLPTTPTIDRLAREGALFDAAFSTSCWTVPSHASLFTGLSPAEHGAHWEHPVLAGDLTTLAEVMKHAGYRTGAFSSNTWITPEGGFGQGFDHFFYRHPVTRPWRDWILWFFPRIGSIIGRTDGPEDSGAEFLTASLPRWIAEEPEAPFFAFVNLMEPHLEYEPPDPFRREFAGDWSLAELESIDQNLVIDLVDGRPARPQRQIEALQALYDGELAYADRALGRIIEWLEESGRLDSTLVIVTSDHGENLGDHPPLDHQLGLWDTLIRVPLVARYPPLFAAGDKRSDLVSLVDVPGTILEAAGIPQEGVFAERPTLMDREAREAVYADYHISDIYLGVIERFAGIDPSPWDRRLTAVRTHDAKLIEASDGSRACYDLNADPLETFNVADTDMDVCHESVRALLDGWRDSWRDPPPTDRAPMSTERLRELRSLGYLP